MTTETQPEVSLSTQVRVLHDLRRCLLESMEAVSRIELQLRLDHQGRYDQRHYLKGLVEAQEATVREQAVKEYQATGDKAPSPGVGIRVSETLDYLTDEALAWCKENLRVALTFDKRVFERTVKGMPTPPTFVSKTPTPTATISPDLSKALGPQPEGPF